MKYIARVGKVWQDKRTGKTHGRELELSNGDSISNYTMVSLKSKDKEKVTFPTRSDDLFGKEKTIREKNKYGEN